jgi:replicative DNA helicase
MHKLVAFQSQLPVNVVVKKKESYEDIQRRAYEDAIRLLSKKGIWLNDKPTQNLSSIREQIVLLQDLLKTQYIVVVLDLFGKISEFQTADNFAKVYEQRCNDLQKMAKELQVHFIPVAQINREATKRKYQRATLADLKNSSALVEISDTMFSVNRPFYDSERALKAKYNLGNGPATKNELIEEDPNKDLAEVIMLKQRMGAGNNLYNFIFDDQTTRFRSIDPEDMAFLNAQKDVMGDD